MVISGKCVYEDGKKMNAGGKNSTVNHKIVSDGGGNEYVLGQSRAARTASTTS
jgi:hypothetical protein